MATGVKLELLSVGSTRHFGALVGLKGWRIVRFPALAALIRHPTAGAILFDTGYGSRVVQSRGLALTIYRHLLPVSLADDERIDRQLEARGVVAAELESIMLSHVHPDHIGGLGDLPPCPLLWSRAVRDAFHAGTELSRFAEATLAALQPGTAWQHCALIEERPRIDLGGTLPGFDVGYDLLGDGTLIAVPLPGHARGQTGLLCRVDDGRTVFLVADAAWIAGNIIDGIEPKAILEHVAHDASAYRETLGRLRRLNRLRPEIIMVPSHCSRSIEAWQGG